MPNCFKRIAIVKANLIPLVFFLRHGSATSAASASLRPFDITCITFAGWKSMEKRLPVALCALARFKSAKKGRCDAEDAEDEIRRETEEKNHSTLPKFFILHFSFFIHYNASPPHLNKLLGEHTSG